MLSSKTIHTCPLVLSVVWFVAERQLKILESILHELYYGNINPNENFFSRNSEYDKVVKTLCGNGEKLLKCLNAEEKEIFETFSKAQANLSETSIADRFVEGFCLGMRIVVEVMREQF